MRIDVQISAHLRQQVAADFFLSILEGLAPGQLLYSPLEFPTPSLF